jgi:hypothetical protein
LKKKVQAKKNTAQGKLKILFSRRYRLTLYYYNYSGLGGKALLGQDDNQSSDDSSDDGVDYFQTGNCTTSFIILQICDNKNNCFT